MTSVVIPCFDEERRIGATLDHVLRYLGGRGEPWEVLVVDDGSSDGTSEIVGRRMAGHPHLRLIRFPVNHGKGWAVREGVAEARGELVLFSDADLSTPIELLPRMEARAGEGCDLVVGSREIEGARILTPQPWRRRASGWVFRNLVRALGLSTFRDTQCGFKLMRRETMAPIVAAMTTEGFAFDVELIFRAEAAGLRVCEQPIDWRDSSGSKVRLYPDALRMARDLLRLRLALGSRSSFPSRTR